MKHYHYSSSVSRPVTEKRVANKKIGASGNLNCKARLRHNVRNERVI